MHEGGQRGQRLEGNRHCVCSFLALFKLIMGGQIKHPVFSAYPLWQRLNLQLYLALSPPTSKSSPPLPTYIARGSRACSRRVVDCAVVVMAGCYLNVYLASYEALRKPDS